MCICMYMCCKHTDSGIPPYAIIDTQILSHSTRRLGFDCTSNSRRPARSLVPAIEEVADHVLGVFSCVLRVPCQSRCHPLRSPSTTWDRTAAGGRERAWQDPAAAAAGAAATRRRRETRQGRRCRGLRRTRTRRASASHGLGMQNTIRKRDALAGARGHRSPGPCGLRLETTSRVQIQRPRVGSASTAESHQLHITAQTPR